jgi:uncharacterized protein YceH (UPF0502 family)
MLELTLSPEEVRVLGALLEKDLATPEYYPLSLNALVNACNQKSNRDPVVEYNEETVRTALAALDERGLGGEAKGHDSRVAKYGHRFGEIFNLGRGELALICTLLLRGPQTPGELRSRTDRMHRFEDLDVLEGCLRRLEERQPQPLVRQLPRQPGHKEVRFAHLFSGAVEIPSSAAPSKDRLTRVEEDLAALRAEFDEFKKQFG